MENFYIVVITCVEPVLDAKYHDANVIISFFEHYVAAKKTKSKNDRGKSILKIRTIVIYIFRWTINLKECWDVKQLERCLSGENSNGYASEKIIRMNTRIVLSHLGMLTIKYI